MSNLRKRKITGNPLKDFEMFYHTEPEFESINKENIYKKIGYILNFYQRTYDLKDSKKFLIKANPQYKQILNNISDIDYSQYITLGFLSKLLSDSNLHLEKDNSIMLWYNNKLNEVLKLKQIKKQELGKIDNRKGNDIQKAILEQVKKIMPAIDEYIDSYIIEENKTNFDIIEYLKKKDLSAIHARKIYNFYLKDLEEFESINNDKQLKEAYNKFSKKRINEIINFYKELLQNIEIFITLKSKNRKSRKPKKISIEKKLASLNYLKVSDSLNIASEKPSKIIGAKFLVTYNVKYKKLCIFESKNGLNVKGSTIYDFVSCIEKTVRKPEEFLLNVQKNGKRKIKSLFSELKTKENIGNGRINKETLLIKIL